MAFQLDTSDLPILGSYAAALQRWGSIIPTRGRAQDTRPLGSRRKTHVVIGKDEPTGDIYVQLYRTRVLTYHVNGNLTLNTGGWNTNSTLGLIHAVAPYHVGVTQRSGRLWVSAHHNGEEGWFWMEDNHITLEPRVVPDGRELFHVVDPKTVRVRRVNRKGMNELRKRFAPLYAFTAAYIKMMWTEHDGPNAARLRRSDETHPYTTSPFEPTDDPVVLRKQMAYAGWRHSTKGYIWGALRNDPRMADAGASLIRREYIDKALRYMFPDVAYHQVEVPLGQIASDAP